MNHATYSRWKGDTKYFMGVQAIQKVWQEHASFLAPEITQVDHREINSRLASFFTLGPFYAYLMDTKSRELREVGENFYRMVGVKPDNFQINSFLERIHPEDQLHFARCEEVAGKILFGIYSPEEWLDFKVSYCFRIRIEDGSYRMILHQALALTLDEKQRLGKVLGVHCDITHITRTNNHLLSLIHMDKGESILEIDLDRFQKEGLKSLSGRPQPISPREREVLVLVAEGLTTEQIGEKLSIAEGTVRKHREHLRKKAGAQNAAHLINLAFRKGWL
ncbi:MAG: LuxR C-terminal-related transcriptional regulator [Bacteroidota bacterium]